MDCNGSTRETAKSFYHMCLLAKYKRKYKGDKLFPFMNLKHLDLSSNAIHQFNPNLLRAITIELNETVNASSYCPEISGFNE